MKVQKIWPCFDSYLDAQNSGDFEREVQFVARQILQCDNQDYMKYILITTGPKFILNSYLIFKSYSFKIF